MLVIAHGQSSQRSLQTHVFCREWPVLLMLHATTHRAATHKAEDRAQIALGIYGHSANITYDLRPPSITASGEADAQTMEIGGGSTAPDHTERIEPTLSI
jgi:hypothetical protein